MSTHSILEMDFFLRPETPVFIKQLIRLMIDDPTEGQVHLRDHVQRAQWSDEVPESGHPFFEQKRWNSIFANNGDENCEQHYKIHDDSSMWVESYSFVRNHYNEPEMFVDLLIPWFDMTKRNHFTRHDEGHWFDPPEIIYSVNNIELLDARGKPFVSQGMFDLQLVNAQGLPVGKRTNVRDPQSVSAALGFDEGPEGFAVGGVELPENVNVHTNRGHQMDTASSLMDRLRNAKVSDVSAASFLKGVTPINNRFMTRDQLIEREALLMEKQRAQAALAEVKASLRQLEKQYRKKKQQARARCGYRPTYK